MVKAEKKILQKEEIEQALVPEEEWPYDVPKNWCWTRLGNISSAISKGTTPKGGKDAYKEKGISFLRIENINDDGSICHDNIMYIDEETHMYELRRSILQVNDILISIAGTLGKTAIISDMDIPLNTNQAIAFIRLLAPEIILPKYVQLYFSSPVAEQQLLGQMKVTSIPNLTLEIISKSKIPVPPLAEQQRIVEQIEILFEKLNTATELIETIKDTAEDRKMSYLSKAFSGKLSAEWRDKNNISLNSWSNFKIDDICDVKGGKRVPKGMELTNENTGHPYIRAGNLKNGTVIPDKMMYVPDEVLSYIKNYTVSKGDVYITNVGACIGDCGIIPEEYDGANLTENAVKLTNLKCNGKFLAYYLASSKVQQTIKGLIASATLGKLSINNIKSIDIKIPSIEEQEFIVSILNNLLEKENLLNECTDVIDEINIIKKVILSKAFQGNLSTTDLSEESSLELLKFIITDQS